MTKSHCETIESDENGTLR